MVPKGRNSRLLINTVKACEEILSLYPTVVSLQALAAKTGAGETDIRKVVKALAKEGVIEIRHISGGQFVKAERAPLERLLGAKKAEYFQAYAADARTIEKYREDLVRGHELEVAVAPHIAALLGWIETLPYEFVCYDDEGKTYYVGDIMKSAKDVDVLVRLGNTLVDVLGSFQPCEFVDVKDYKVSRATIVPERLMFLHIDTFNGKYAFTEPEWIRENGRYIVHPEWVSPGVKKFTYRLDNASLAWKDLPEDLTDMVKRIAAKYRQK
jgi:biotin operon repressor